MNAPKLSKIQAATTIAEARKSAINCCASMARFYITLPNGERKFFFTGKGAKAWLRNEAEEGRKWPGVQIDENPVK